MATETTEIDVRRELDDAPVGPFHWLLVILVFFATLFDGYDTFIPAYTIHFIAEPWGLSPSQAGFLVAAGLIGFAIGSLSNGIIADRIGRRPTLIAGLLVAGVLTLLTGLLADSFESFAILRLLTGLGLGVLLPLGTTYINEYLPAKVRNRLAVLGAIGFALGGVLAAGISVLFTQTMGWEILYWVGSGAALVGVLYIFIFPESVEYLVARGRQQQAVRLLSRVRPERAGIYANASLIVSTARHPGRSGAGRDWQLPLRAFYLRRTMALWASSFFLLFCIYALSGWLPKLMIERGESFAVGNSFGAIFLGVSVLGALAGGNLADRRLGAQRTLMLWCGLGAVSALVVVTVNTTLTNIIAVAGAGFFIVGGQYMLNNLCAATYPIQARAAGEGYMLGIGRAGGILGPLISGVLLGIFGGTNVVFVAVALAAGLGIVSTAFAGGTTTLGEGPTPLRQSVQQEPERAAQ